MNKKELLTVIINNQQKLAELRQFPKGKQGGIKVAEALIEKAKQSVEGTEDSLIFNKTFAEIANQLPSIISNLNNPQEIQNQVNYNTW